MADDGTRTGANSTTDSSTNSRIACYGTNDATQHCTTTSTDGSTFLRIVTCEKQTYAEEQRNNFCLHNESIY